MVSRCHANAKAGNFIRNRGQAPDSAKNFFREFPLKKLIINIETKDRSPEIISRGLSRAIERMNGMNEWEKEDEDEEEEEEGGEEKGTVS